METLQQKEDQAGSNEILLSRTRHPTSKNDSQRQQAFFCQWGDNSNSYQIGLNLNQCYSIPRQTAVFSPCDKVVQVYVDSKRISSHLIISNHSTKEADAVFDRRTSVFYLINNSELHHRVADYWHITKL